MRAQNLPPGPRICEMLATLQELVLVDPAVNTKEELLKVLGEMGEMGEMGDAPGSGDYCNIVAWASRP